MLAKIYVNLILWSIITYVRELLYNDLHEIPISDINNDADILVVPNFEFNPSICKIKHDEMVVAH